MNRFFSACFIIFIFLGVGNLQSWADDATDKAAGEKAAKEKEEAEAKKKADINKDPAESIIKLQEMAEDAKSSKMKADSAWMMMSTALVLLMVPGLALFYGGMVRRKNILATMMQSMVALAVVGVYWIAIGYSLAFGDPIPWLTTAKGSFLGFSPDLVFLKGVKPTDLLPGGTIPVYLHMLFQGMFAIITPALISGAVAERIRFKPYCIFLILWVTVVYCPLAHCVWAMDWHWAQSLHGTVVQKVGETPVGFLGKMDALDFAGGTVVHIAAGFSALAAILILRKRVGYPEHAMHPNSMVLTLTGAGLLWFGWFGFNGGSGLASGELAVCAFAASQAAAAAAGSELDACRMAASRQTDRPGPGFRHRGRAGRRHAGLRIRLPLGRSCHRPDRRRRLLRWPSLSSPVSSTMIRSTLSAFTASAASSGAVLTGVFCTKDVNSTGQNGLLLGSTGADNVLLPTNPSQVGIQLFAALASAVVAFGVSLVLIKIIDMLIGFTSEVGDEVIGLDRSEHGETGFDFGLATEAATIGDDVEPRAANVPPAQGKRFQVVLEGPPTSDLLHAWGDLCQPSKDVPKEFKTVYPFLTTVTGNRFQFRGGDPTIMRDSLQQLLSKRLQKPLTARVEGNGNGAAK